MQAGGPLKEMTETRITAHVGIKSNEVCCMYDTGGAGTVSTTCSVDWWTILSILDSDIKAACWKVFLSGCCIVPIDGRDA